MNSSAMESSGHKGKPFYCRDWVFEKLKACLNKRQQSATCGTLVMGDSGSGKTAFCTELVWPSRDNPSQRELSRRLLAYHFCSVIGAQSLSLSNFLHHISSQLTNHDIIGEEYSRLVTNQQSTSVSASNEPDKYMLTQIITPLNELHKEPSQVLYILVDGLDECEDCPAVNDSHSQTIPQLLSRFHRRFPPWLALVCTCSTKARRISRLFTGFRKLAIDDITRSHVVQDIQQYILHRLDADSSLKRHLDKDMAEVLDKLHVKCNGCILYIELILDMVSQGTVLLRHVDEIPATLGGLYLWICQRLFDDVSDYQLIAKPVFSILLATRVSLTSEVIYNSLLTRNRHIKYDDLHRCLQKLSPILLTLTADSAYFSHPSFRIWLQDVKFCSKNYLCDIREGHELLTLYYTVAASSLSNELVCEYAHHIQRSNSRVTGSSSSWQKSSTEGRDLTIHEQAVWMLLSEAQLQAPSMSVSTSMVDSLVVDTACLSVSTVGEELSLSNSTETREVSVSPQTFATPDHSTGTQTTGQQEVESSDAAKADSGVSEPEQEADATLNESADEGSVHDVTAGSSQVLEQVVADKLSEADVADADMLLADDEEEPDELQCLDEDLEGVEMRDGVLDSDIDSLSSPVATLEPSNHHQTSQGGPVCTTLEQALLLKDLSYLERAIDQGLDVNLPDKDGKLPLVYAASQGHLEVVEMLILMAGAEVNLPDLEQRTALEAASCTGDDAIVSFLLNNEANVNRQSKDGGTALLSACSQGHGSTVELLLSHGADINSTQNDGQTALCVACSCGSPDQISANHVEVVKILIQSNVDANAADEKQETPLHHVCYRGSEELCDVLLAADAAVDPVDDQQRTPLLCAVSQGHIKVAERLIAAGADVHHLDQNGRTSLGLACIAGHQNLVSVFLEMGQDEMHRDNQGVDCLHFAAMEGHTVVTRQLLNYGADVNSGDDQGRTSLLLAAQNGKLDALNVLLTHGADTNLPAHNGKTPLRAACVGGHAACARSLLRHGADASYIDMEGRSIIYILALENSPECIRLLVESGADVNAPDEQGRTALHVACWQGHLEVVNALLDLDAVIDIEDNERRTPLQSAAWQGHAHIAELLCSRGANVSHMCDQGATPLCIAAQEGFLQLVAVLCEYGADPNHSDRFGRTALKIAMKANNYDLLHLLENIMRRYKPAALAAEAACSRTGSDNAPTAVYENCSTHRSDQSGNSSLELVAPYAVVSLPRDDSKNAPPKLLPRDGRYINSSRLHSNASSPNLQRQSRSSDSRPIAHHHSASSIGSQPKLLAESHLAADMHFGQSKDRQQMSSAAITSQLQSGDHSQLSSMMDDMSETSDGCDTAPSTPSSAREGNSTDSDGSTSNLPSKNSGSRSSSHQLVQLGSRQTHNPSSNVHQILSGEVGYMANPKINQALYNASQIAAGNIVPPTEHVPTVRSPNRNLPSAIGASKLSRQPNKQSSRGNKMAAMQNTARTPTYKVQYAAADHPHTQPASYAVRNNELMSAEHSLSSVKSRQAKIVSSSGAYADAPSNHNSGRYSPPPDLPPRKGRPSHPLHSVAQASRPTLVGVVRPRAHEYGNVRTAKLDVPNPHRTGQKETSL